MSQSQPIDKKPRVAVSYSWTEEKEGRNKGSVGNFHQTLREKGVGLIRDTVRLQHGAKLREFMEHEIAGANRLCVFLSEGYLRSPNCMFELVRAWEISKVQGRAFDDCVKAWIMPGLSLDHTSDRVAWTDHWTTTLGDARKAVEGRDAANVASELKEIERIESFARHVNDILNYIRSTLKPKDVAGFAEWAVSEFRLEGLDRREFLGARKRIIEAIEDAISGDEAFQVVFSGIADLGAFSDGRFVVSEVLHRESTAVSQILTRMRSKLKARAFNEAQRKVLWEIAGGVAALGVRPSWVEQQVRDLEGEKVILQARIETRECKPFTSSFDSGYSANLLHVVARVLSGHHIDDDAFSKRGKDTRVIRGTRVFQGIDFEDEEFEMKKNFVKVILKGETDVVPSEAEAKDPSLSGYKARIEAAYEDVLQHLKLAYTQGTPWRFESAPSMSQASRARRLRLQHVFFLMPREGNFENVFKESIFVLGELDTIAGLLGRR